MPQLVRPFNIMAKPVCGVCNLDCAYCYYTMKPRELYPGVSRFQMSDETLRAYTRQYMELMPVHVDFGWQGGEPTLAGIDFFRRAVALQKEFGRDGQEVANAFQTNGTLLDDAWCELLAEYKFLVGLSLDGPPQWHDHYRRDKAGNPSFHRAMHGLELLRKHNVEFNILVTLNSVNAPHAGDIYRYFTNRDVRYLQFIPILERDEHDRPAPFSCTPQQWGRFLLDVFELWATRDVGRVSERLIDSVIHQLVFGTASTCCYADRCANAHVLEWSGDLYVCDHFVYKPWRIGNINERPLAELIADPMLERFAELKTAVPDKCLACEYFEFCRGGCPKHHMPIGTDPARVNGFCEGYKLFFRESLGELRRMAEFIKRNEMPPLKGSRQQAAGSRNGTDDVPSAPEPEVDSEGLSPAFRAGPPAGAAEPLKPQMLNRTPGRNDPCPCGSGRKYKKCCGAG